MGRRERKLKSRASSEGWPLSTLDLPGLVSFKQMRLHHHVLVSLGGGACGEARQRVLPLALRLAGNTVR